ncbi:unnamed protein product [Rotaria magnacalcarata]|uniref:Cyclin-like domain-containing protein n=1 Tax=Rotaria magnacalcarata TaxID=392030 RepID=A0A819QUY6_9BILA|nr:unnamed protein product [Rotaria magnacalcarata]CAF2073059.1 unnamed protein product [Rotaria magnacalcarata]CAF2073595.1 unnamed protein product [Rotaria magnacalcarata]CAF2077720.1 unnamed protein product [Rotaria magnacalcarata]CAF3830443.1 unnamed protein product [Rotaria magnacalcarata]
MSSSSFPKILPKTSLHLHSSSSSSSICKSSFIWRFPPKKFDSLPSCISKRSFTSNIQPLNINDELMKRQELAILIYDLGLHLNVSFTCIYTGVIYMHRFFMLHPFQQCIKESVAAACLFLACKVNEMPRPLNEFTRHLCQLINQISNSSDNFSSTSSSIATTGNITSEVLSNYNQQIIDYENILLSSLGFCLNVDQPYMIITRTSQTLSIPKEIAQKACEIATKCIFFTVFSMKYTTNLIACFALYMAITSSQINMPDNQDGSQWFHLLNEEFTEKLLQELVDDYNLICMEKCLKKSEERFEQIRQQTRFNCQQTKSKSNYEQSNVTTSLHDNEQNHYVKATTIGSVRSTALSSSLIQQQQPLTFCEYRSMSASIETHHHTPNQSSLMNFSHNEYSPLSRPTVNSPTTIIQPSVSPKQNQNNISEKNHTNNSSMIMSSAKPIPTLMTSLKSNTNSYDNYAASGQHLRFSTPILKYPSSSPNQQFFRLPAPSLHGQHFQHQYSSTFTNNSSYYPQQQTPLFYHPQQDLSNINNKRYGEPPAPPMKRFRYNINAYHPY